MKKRHRKKAVNEYPAAILTIDQLVSELVSRPDFRGAVVWQNHPGGSDWTWRSNNCAAGILFLQMATSILTQAANPPPTPAEPTA